MRHCLWSKDGSICCSPPNQKLSSPEKISRTASPSNVMKATWSMWTQT